MTDEVRKVLECLRRRKEAEVVGGGEGLDGAGRHVVAAVVAVFNCKHDRPRFLQPLNGVIAVHGSSDLHTSAITTSEKLKRAIEKRVQSPRARNGWV